MAKKKITLDEIKSIEYEKLATLVYEEIVNSKEFYKKIEKVILSSNPKELIKAIKKDIASIRRGSKFIDYYNSFEFSKKVQNIVNDIFSMVEDKKVAAKLFKELVLTDSKVYLRSDDSSGVIQESYRNALDGWIGCVESMSEDEIYQDVHELLVCEGFGTRDFLGEHISNRVLIKLYDEYFDVTNHTNIDMFDRVRLLKETAHYLKEPKRFIDALKLEEKNFEDYHFIDIATEYQYAMMPKEVLEQLQQVKEISLYNAKKFYALQVWAYEQLNEPLNVTLTYKNWYEKSKDVLILKKYLSYLDGVSYKKVREEALEYAQSFSLGEALNFFYELDEKELAQNYIFENQKYLSENHLYDAQIKKIEKWFKDEFPEALILLYRAICEQALSQSISKHYPKGVKAIKSSLLLEEKSDSSSWSIESNEVYLQKLIEKHKKKSRFIQLLSQI